MHIFLVKKRKFYAILLMFAIFATATAILVNFSYSAAPVNSGFIQEVSVIIEELINKRNEAVLNNDTETLSSFYNKDVRYGLWAYEHQVKKTRYLHQWAEKQGVKFTSIKTEPRIITLKEKGNGFTSYFNTTTIYEYSYEDTPDITNLFRIGAEYTIEIQPHKGEWVIVREWYSDPFADAINPDNLENDDLKTYLLAQKQPDYSALNDRRKQAVEYADKYCGLAGTEETGYSYNKKYKNYNPLGGDCANFASQILHEGGGFRKTYTWNYDKDGSQAWINAQVFKSYLIYSGRGSVLAYGPYEKVFKNSFKLLPGDIVAYEEKGKVKHISVVTGSDNKGYVLVNCHNIDRYRVPWDLGWSDKNIRFWLIRVHY